MKPAPFTYIRADTTAEVLHTLDQHGADARILAGGQSLIAMLNMRLAKPAYLIDIMRIPARLTETVDSWTIPAATRQAALQSHPALAAQHPLLAQALPWVGHQQTRSRGTVCGSVAHADPSAEIPLCLVALQGQITLRSRRRHRTLPAESFFSGMMMTEKADDEFIDSITIPTRRPATGYAFAEIGRRHGDFAIVACAAVVDATCMRLAIGGVADRPTARDFPILQGSALDDALNDFAWSLGGGDDPHATARYRRHLVRQLGRQTLEEASTCRT